MSFGCQTIPPAEIEPAGSLAWDLSRMNPVPLGPPWISSDRENEASLAHCDHRYQWLWQNYTCSATEWAIRNPILQIDEMYWQENWTLRKSEEFCELVAAAIATDRWVIDGHGASAKMMIWQRATHIIWLNYPFVRVFSQMLRRTIQRVWTREVIF